MPQDTLTTTPPQEEAPKRTYTGRLRPPPSGWSSGPPEAGMDDLASAAWESGQLNDKLTDSSVALNRAYSNLIAKGREAGLSIDWHPLQVGRDFVEREPQMARVERWHAEVNRQIAANPKLAEALGPVTRETMSGMADQLSRDAMQKYMEIKERRGADFWSLDTLVEFGVGMGVSMTDPLEAPTAFAGMGTKTILGAIAEGAAINAGIEVARQPFVQSRQVRIGNVENWEEGVANAMANVTIAGALGGALSGAGKTIEKVFFEPGQERAAVARAESDRKFEHARVSMRALAAATEPTDPESAAIVRKALSEAEREYATAQQAPDMIEADEFAAKVEAADDFLRRVTEFVERPDPRRPDPPAERLDTTDDGPPPKIGDALVEDGKPVAFQQFDPRELGVAPDEMQYKRFSGEEGVNGAIADVETWHAPSSGKILVFERANGERVIADGHQRRSKAIGIMQAQGRDDIRLDGYLYREVDGWTVADLRLKGAQKNIREGRSDVLDTAQALRERPDAIDSSFPLSRSNIRQARQLARLSPEAWDLTRAGVLEPGYAALIGQVAPDRPAIHAPLARTLIEAAPDNVRQAENIVSEALLDYAERSVETQASLFGDDNLGRAVMYKERAQIMDAAYAWLRSERSVFKALVDKGDIARALGNELVDAANLNAKDQVELAIAAVMHSRKAGVRTAVTDMISRALDSVRREGVTPARAGQQVAREIRALVEERGFRALLDAEGPAPPQFAEAGPLFDGPGSKAHAEQADMLEGDLRPEGNEDPGVVLADAVKQPDEVTSLVDELKGAGEGGGDRTPDQILNDIRKLLKPKKEGEAKGTPKPADAMKEVEAQIDAVAKAETQLRDILLDLTDVQKLSLIRMQYPDAYPYLNRLEGPDLDDAIIGRVMAGDVKFAKRGDILVLDLPTNQRIFSPGQPDDLGFITSAEQALANPPPRFRDAKELTADQWRKLMREGGASKEAFTYQIEPALKSLTDPAEIAKAEGFNPGTTLYHGTRQSFSRFQRSEGGTDGAGVYLTTSKDKADGYAKSSRAGEGSPRVMSLWVRGEIVDGEALVPPDRIPPAAREWLDRRKAKYKGQITYADYLRDGAPEPPVGVAGVKTGGTTVVVFNPNDIREVDSFDAGDITREAFEEALARNRTRLQQAEQSDVTFSEATFDPTEPGSAETQFSEYVAPGPSKNYRQEVLVLPGLPYKSHNWNTPGAVGHIRTTHRRSADGRKVMHVEELQSDLHQEAAKFGYRGEVPSAFNRRDALLNKLDDQVERYNAWWKQHTDKYPDEESPPPSPRWLRLNGTEGSLELIEDAVGRELWRTAMATMREIDNVQGDGAIPPRAPMENWEEPFVRHALQTAAKDGIDTVTFPTHATLHEAIQNQGTKAFYDQRLPRTLARVAKSLGLKVETVQFTIPAAFEGSGRAQYRIGRGTLLFGEPGIEVEFKDRDTGKEWGRVATYETRAQAEAYIARASSPQVLSVPAIRLTREAKAKLRDGVVMYARSGESRIGMDVQSVRQKLTQEFGDGANALGRIGELNITDRPPVWAAPDTIGLTDAQGRVTIFAANVEPDALRGLVLHEVGVHAGLEGVLGKAGKQRLLDDLGDRMRAVAPDHPIWGAAATGSDVRFAQGGQALQYEPLSTAAADDLLDLTPDEWAAEIKATKYAAYRLPEGVAEAALPRGYVVVLSQDGAYAVRSDNLRNRQAAGAKVTEVEIEVAVDGGERTIDKSLRAAMDKVPIDTDRAHVVEETLAYLVQHAPKHSFVQRLIADIRTWFYRTFPKMQEWMTLTEADMVSLAMGAVRERIKEAGWSTPIARTRNGATFVEPIRLARYSDRPVMPLTDAELLDAAQRLRPMQFEIFKAAREGLSSEAIAERINAARPDATVKPETVRVNLVRLRKKGFEIPNAPRPGLSPDTLRIFELKAQGLKVAQIAQRVYPDIDPEVAKNRVYVLLSVRKDRPEVNSTSPVKYARRSADGSRSPQESRNTQVRGRPGGPRQPDAGPGGDAGAGAAGGGDVQSGARPVRALATEPLPAAPVAEGDWNSRVILTPDQRASRREQFREFVDSAVVAPEVSIVVTDWRFRNGKRVIGPAARVESRRYVVQTADDMHPDWLEALDSSETRVTAEVHGGEATIHDSAVAAELRSTGLGEKLYMQAIDDMLARGLVVNSDVSMSDNAIALWKSLRNKGYEVIQRVPDSLLEVGDDGQKTGDDITAIFFVARKKPPAPDLPMSDRDIANKIDEARALAEHMPACIKGKGRAA